jgi:N-terminal domain of NWD NACHT-NTPase
MPEESRSLGKVLRRFGLSKQERLKGKDDGNRQDGKVAPPVVPATPSKSSAQTEPTIQPEQLWDQAYDDLKRDEPKLFDFYETILSHDLDSSKGAKGNIIEQTDRMKRRSQMEDLLNTGLDNTAKLAKAEKKIGDAMKIVLSVKEAIGSGLQAVPIAALAWAGICVALEASLPSLIQLLTLTIS